MFCRNKICCLYKSHINRKSAGNCGQSIRSFFAFLHDIPLLHFALFQRNGLPRPGKFPGPRDSAAGKHKSGAEYMYSTPRESERTSQPSPLQKQEGKVIMASWCNCIVAVLSAQTTRTGGRGATNTPFPAAIMFPNSF